MNDVSFASKVWGTDDTSETPDWAPALDMQDAAEFQRLLHTQPQASESGASSISSVGSVLGSVNRTLHEHEDKFDKALKKVARNGDPVASLDLQKHLSDTFLSHGLAVKVISKTTQGLESLMKLQ